MKKHLKEQFSNWIMPLMVVLISMITYFTTEDMVYTVSLFIRSAVMVIALYVYGAFCAYEAELNTRQEYEPEEPEV